MTRKQAVAFLREWQPILCPEWEISVAEGPSPDCAADEHLAAINAGDGNYLRATLYLHETTTGNLGAEDECQALFHELLHLTLKDLELAASEPLNALGYETRRLATENLDRFLERTVDRLATAFAAIAD